jgi:hypothetical protein
MHPWRTLPLLALACLPAAAHLWVSPVSNPTPEETRSPEADDLRWFPRQAAPKALVRTVKAEEFPEPRLATGMMVQSVAGLAAQAVNEGRSDEMVWVATGNADVERWYARLLARRPPPEARGVFAPWDLVERYRKRGVVKGYLLYRLDRSRGELNEHRPGMDRSVNVATSLAGLLGGVLIDEGLEAEARRRGLELLLDARGKTQAWCFGAYKDRFNRRLLCTQDPRKPNARDLAIAQRALTLYGDGEPLAGALKWLEPLSPVLGWNGGDEFQTTRASTVWGHLQTATDWCMNLPVLMAGSDRAEPAKARRFDPRKIDWADRRSAVSFLLSDGDNAQWQLGDFFGNQSYWGSGDRGRVPFGWSCCFAHLAQLCPPAVEHAATTQTANDRFVEWGGGYYYPDLFASERPGRWGLLARHARRTWEMMRRTGLAVIGFNVSDLGSADARKAYEVFAGETDGLLGILAFQYAPYEGGGGRTFWVKDRRGVDVPVVTARYSIWGRANARPRSGTPAKVAREIREAVARAPKAELPRYDWVIAHPWSYFRRAPGADEAAEDMPQPGAPGRGGVRGYAPVTWCAERLPKGVRVVCPEELLWRIRMGHDAAQTRAAIRRLHP